MYPADLRYTKDHEWVRVSGDTAEIGITDFAQRQLGDVVYVELPDVGQTITAGATFGTIESVKAVSDLYAPMSGEVVATNEGVKAHPEVVNAQPHESWMIKIRLRDGAETAPLLNASDYERLVTA